MKPRDILEEITPSLVQDIQAGLNPQKVYMVQPRRWTGWLLRGILAVAVLLAALVLIGIAATEKMDAQTWLLIALLISPTAILALMAWRRRKARVSRLMQPR